MTYRRSACLPTGAAGSEPACLVVMYHYVGDRELPLSRGVKGLSVAAFEQQLDDLCSWGTPVGWSQLLDAWTGVCDLPERSFLLTFDDGLSDHAATVAPILGERRLSGIFFVPTRVLAEPAMLPAHQVHVLLSVLNDDELTCDVLRRCRSLDPTICEEVMNGVEPGRRYPYERPERARLKYLLTFVLPPGVRQRILSELFREHVGDEAAWSRRWYLSASQVSELAAAGHTIGGHGFAHEPLANLPVGSIRQDVARSASILRDLLGPGARPFSYPFGSTNDAAASAVHHSGFTAAFTTQSRLMRPDDLRFALPRVDTINVNQRLSEQTPCMV